MIDLDGVTVAFDTVTAVEGVDLGVESGEFVTVVGPSGCGKTTLLRVIGGLVEPTDGTLTVGSAPPANAPTATHGARRSQAATESPAARRRLTAVHGPQRFSPVYSGCRNESTTLIAGQ